MGIRGFLTTIFMGAFFICGVMFAYINRDSCTINFYFKTITLPGFFVILLSVFLGVLIMVSVSFIDRIRLSSTIRRQKKVISEMGKEIESLRKPETRESSEFGVRSAEWKAKSEIQDPKPVPGQVQESGIGRGLGLGEERKEEAEDSVAKAEELTADENGESVNGKSEMAKE